MKLPVKVIIKKGKSRKDGTSLLFIQYCYSKSKRVLLNSDISIPEKYWNKETGRIVNSLPVKFGNAKELEAELRHKTRLAEKLIDYATTSVNTCPVRFLKRNFKRSINLNLDDIGYDKGKQCVFSQIDLYLRDKTGLVQEATLTTIRTMKKHLAAFQEVRKAAITFDSFDLTFYNDFIRYLTYEYPLLRRSKLIKGLKTNSTGKTIKHLKSFLKDRMARKIIPYFDLGFLKCLNEDVDAVYLSWSELSSVYHLDLSQVPYLIKYRDLFVLGCLTGFRFSDYSNIQITDIRDGMLHIVQKKTSSVVIVPIREDARQILIEKYQMSIPKISMANLNYYIKEIAWLAGITEPIKISHKKGNQLVEEVRPKYAWVSSHTARRSFCTNEYLAGTPGDLIMAISGHKTEKAFRTYIKADNIQKASMIKEIWKNRPAL